MGLEGAITGTYYRCFGRMIRKGFSFERRTRRPPLDPVNALLSLGYAMITNEIAALLESAGFDPFIGFLHGFRYGRQSLPLDLVEEFRHSVVDALTLNLLNKCSFKQDDFYRAEDGACFLQKEAFKRYLTFYEEHLDKPRGEEKKSFRDLFKIQVEKIEKAVLNNQEYDPFLQWEID
jgi:CRISPR-associated protein Cas1